MTTSYQLVVSEDLGLSPQGQPVTSNPPPGFAAGPASFPTSPHPTHRYVLPFPLEITVPDAQ